MTHFGKESADSDHQCQVMEDRGERGQGGTRALCECPMLAMHSKMYKMHVFNLK